MALSQIHVDDIATAVLASMQEVGVNSGKEGTAGQEAVFNLGDNEPTPRKDVMRWAASLMPLLGRRIEFSH